MATNNQNPSSSLRFLYRTTIGRIILKPLTCRPISKLGGTFFSSKMSTRMIKGFIEKNNIDMSQFENREFKSYNDFFTRKLRDGAREIDMSPDALISPCDSRLTAYKIDDRLRFYIKGRKYSLREFLGGDKIATEFSGGLCLVFRLCVDDYHRYCYFDSGKSLKRRYIKGKFHTVQPIALERYNYYHENAREYEVIKTENFGLAVQSEVGALMVGKIVNHNLPSFKRGDEKGYFEFGGSTIVVLLKSGKATLRDDIVKASQKFEETRVKFGEKIGQSERKFADEQQ